MRRLARAIRDYLADMTGNLPSRPAYAAIVWHSGVTWSSCSLCCRGDHIADLTVVLHRLRAVRKPVEGGEVDSLRAVPAVAEAAVEGPREGDDELAGLLDRADHMHTCAGQTVWLQEGSSAGHAARDRCGAMRREIHQTQPQLDSTTNPATSRGTVQPADVPLIACQDRLWSRACSKPSR